MDIAGIYLGAGASRRMGRSKLSIELAAGRRLGGYALDQALQSALNRVVVVTRGGEVDWLSPSFGAACTEGRLQRAVCFDSDKGMAHSLRCGLQAACEVSEPDAVVVLLADQPLVSAEMINRLIGSYKECPGLDYVAAGCLGAPRPPVLFAKSMFDVLRKLEGDEGARSLFGLPHYSGMIREEAETYRFLDADTPEDLERIRFFYRIGKSKFSKAIKRIEDLSNRR
ncbi:xanthine dehydrogenase [Paenibacillus sp. H1-7]|uniref:nucleotidyltransferase family protein n=1 Tax=Paenibacillus sp. H1-7 TaxID=2282849 RepID=UPI001EF939D4|nr:nucleotidyltransferase family protein [Paenibacillus sp. H1-7]ULL19689.1 xanthine dehydrogenase [Paenibacillus sp. H1-7]